MSYTWNLPEKVDKKIIEKFPELHPTVAQLLYNRGLETQAQVDEFLHPDYGDDIHDPFLFKDMKKACERIYGAIEKKEKIVVYGDYDADGVCSSVILTSVLESLGATVEAYLPHREKEGYGLNAKAIEEFSKNNTKLVITCDCGISNTEEVSLANDKNLDIIITDHHAVPEKPPKAVAIIHPQGPGEEYPFKFLAGGGVAFKLAQGLIKYNSNKKSDKEKELQEKWLLDMVAISTVADMVPLLGENRTLLIYGLIVLQKTQRVGLQKLLDVANVDKTKIDARNIGFTIGPRINAAGRMDHANLAYYLLKETDPEEATKQAAELNQSNVDRQKLTETIVRQAKAQEINLADSLFVFYQADWSAGLTGLVAGRLVRTYARPAFVLTDVGDHIVGSGRSIKGFNITEGLKSIEDILERYGGHPQAAGFTIKKENLDEFRKRIIKYANDNLKDQEFENSIDIELVVDFTEINWEMADLVEKFKPFGHSNEEPTFLSKDVIVTDARKVGNDGKHLKLELVKENKKLGAIAFGFGKQEVEIGNHLDLVYNVNINQWNGNREIQLIIRDIKQHES
ncbi:single-stranded-DNA-specific exonuclease RecJ [Candidatus Parcubacteria bacterium]|jgi:single-stranded-DNA-specific exonuclease|nr:single-stranded-DNA-specific exonuclease RecJ [Candidatus Parcubacteria bacterium]MBT7228237.1 single-stranded-DNA-specific exonuclease RecJ [Candidatus Parcubacteria bacterium]